MQPLTMIRRGGRRLRGASEPMAVLPRLSPEHVSVVTGASSGIGLETAVGLARCGGTVWLVGRNPERTRAAVERVRAEAGHERVQALRADFSRLDDVRRLAAEIGEKLDAIDVLVNNAGLWHAERRLSAEGIEDTLAVNHLAPFLLTALVRGQVEARGGRVVTVASRLHVEARGVSMEDPAWERRPYRGVQAYAESKLANVLFGLALARRMTSGVSVVVHPGDVATDVTRDSRLLSLGSRLVAPLLLTPWEGAQTTLHAATCEEPGNGTYFSGCAPARPSALARDASLQERLWAWTARAVGVEA